MRRPRSSRSLCLYCADGSAERLRRMCDSFACKYAQPLTAGHICEQDGKPGSVSTVIYLGGLLPNHSSHLLENDRAGLCVLPTVLLRIEFTASDSFQPTGELLPRLSILTDRGSLRIRQCGLMGLPRSAVYFCCTFPEVAFGGRYPLSLPCGARTFLMTGLSPPPRDCLSNSFLFYRRRRILSTRISSWYPFPTQHVLHGFEHSYSLYCISCFYKMVWRPQHQEAIL